METLSNIQILYIHGMGGGQDSRIPAILAENIDRYVAAPSIKITIVIRTYDFDPEIAHSQIESWVQEVHPSLVVGESLGSIHAIRIKGIPHILVSPSLFAPVYLYHLAFLTVLPGITALADWWFHPKKGHRQPLHFTYGTLRKYGRHIEEARKNMPVNGSQDSFYSFFGTRDHYRLTGVVRVKAYEKAFGRTYSIYKGTHFMEEEYIHSLLIPKILETLNIPCISRR